MNDIDQANVQINRKNEDQWKKQKTPCVVRKQDKQTYQCQGQQVAWALGGCENIQERL